MTKIVLTVPMYFEEPARLEHLQQGDAFVERTTPHGTAPEILRVVGEEPVRRIALERMRLVENLRTGELFWMYSDCAIRKISTITMTATF